jgi:FKBP-type peptidyl-prolyl cis-trans isomerase FkpA
MTNHKKLSMKKTVYAISLPLAFAIAMACNNNVGYKKTKSGLLYKIVETGKSAVANKGDILKLEYTQKINDSVLGTSRDRMPAYMKIDSVPDNAYNPAETFKFLRKGDSVVVVQLVDTLLKKFPAGAAPPPFMKKGKKIYTAFKVVDVFTSDSLASKDSEKYMEKENARQMAEMKKKQEEAEKEMRLDLATQTKEMEAWLAKKGIAATKTGSGTYVVVNMPGNGNEIKDGNFVSVKYTGKKLSDDQVFESNMDGKNPPFSFPIGQGRAIRGWDEGIKLFKKGGKGTLYIPGALAYGRNPPPGSPFKANEALIFDLEIVEVADKPSEQQPRPPMPH